MKFIKHHKIKLMLLIIFILVFIIALVVIVNLFYPDSKKSVYGNRLSGIEKAKISNQIITQINDELNSIEAVNSSSFSLNGRLINFVIEVKEGTKVSELDKFTKIINDKLEDEIKSFYDIQLIIDEKSKDSKNYPIFGYKHKSVADFIWTNNK